MQSANHHHSRGPRILVVDDNAFMRRSLRYVLESQDQWEVVDEASDGVEAVAKFSVLTHYDGFQKGVLDSRDLLYFLSVMAFALFATGVVIRNHRTG